MPHHLNQPFTAVGVFWFKPMTFDLMQVSAAVEFAKLTHPHPKVPGYVEIYSRALHAVLGGAGVRQQAEHALRRLDVWDVCQSYSRRAARYHEVEPITSTASTASTEAEIACFRFARSSEERLKVHQSAVNYLGLACYTKGSD